MITVAGIDVGKANLDVSVSGGQVVRFDNTTAGITKLIKHLNDEDTALALCEPTGGYERMLTSRLHQCAIAVQVVHPGRVRAFAKACGYEAKTDPLDAQVLARYGEVFPEADTWEPETDPHRQELKDLLRRRRQFIDQRVQEKGRLDKGISTTIARSTKRHIAWLEKEIARLDREYQAVLKDNPALAELANLYRTVPGVGPLTAATLVAYLPELGHWDSKALTSLVGLAPGPETAARSEAIAPSGVAGDWCGAPSTCAPGPRSATTARCVASMTACVSAVSRATSQWWR